MTNNEKFLDLYNQLENLIRQTYGPMSSAVAFEISLLRRSRNQREQNLAEDLDSIRLLRNFLVHTAKVDNENLANVNYHLIEVLEEIIAHIENPPHAFDKAIPENKLFRGYLDSSVKEIMTDMHVKGYSQVPILDRENHLLGVFSESVMASYLLRNNEIISFDNLTMKDLMDYLPIHKHSIERYLVLNRYATVEDMAEEFSESKKKHGKRLVMGIFTDNGRADGHVIGAIVPSSLFED
ncbi:MAG: CBS domain-containing protein [Bacilli bacterium]|nr:CBS domain-containing protein [Bacilli bacterium]